MARQGTVIFLPIGQANAASEPEIEAWSRTGPYPNHEVYYPGTETLAADEMRVIACGMGVPNHESFPPPPQRQKQPPDSMTILSDMFSETTLTSIEPESAAVTNAQIEAFNKRNGTNVKPGLTAVPFMDKN